MKNVKHMSKANEPPPYFNNELLWSEEWVPLAKVIKHQPLQVRKKLTDSKVKQYAEMTRAGTTPPPIMVGKVGALLYLLDGWHRMEAGALQTTTTELDGETMVCARVAVMTGERMGWEAAQANLSHGVSYGRGEFRGVFRAFIKAKQHHRGYRQYMSYREMASVLRLGASYGTLRRWTEKDFPSLFRALGANEHGNALADVQTLMVKSMEQQHSEEAHKSLVALKQHAGALSDPENRWTVVQHLEATLAMLKDAGIQEPAPADF